MSEEDIPSLEVPVLTPVLPDADPHEAAAAGPALAVEPPVAEVGSIPDTGLSMPDGDATSSLTRPSASDASVSTYDGNGLPIMPFLPPLPSPEPPLPPSRSAETRPAVPLASAVPPSSASSEPKDPATDAEPEPMTMEMAASHVTSPQSAPPKIPLAPMKRMQARFNPLADGMVYLVVFLGGFVGTTMRYGLNLIMPDALADTGILAGFHPATFIANMLACFIFATLTAYLSQASWIRKRARQLANRGLGMGMCGGFSTLSAMALEDLTAMHTGEIAGFMLYTLLSFLFGLIAAWSGSTLGLEAAAKRSARDAAAALADGDGHGDDGRHAGETPGATVAGMSVAMAETPASVGADGGSSTVSTVSSGGAPAPSTAVRVEQSEPLLATTLVPSFEPDPVTDEIPMVADPLRGEARER